MSFAENSKKWLDKVYSAKNLDELAKGYDGWAKQYDKDVLSFGYMIPSIVSGLFCRYISQDTNKPILDAGAGTGIMGEILALLGYKQIAGIDLSQGMLDVAQTKNAYSSLRQMVLGEKLDYPDNEFSTTLSTGVFTQGHAPPESFDELIRITQPGGIILFSVRADVDLGLDSKLKELEDQNKWQLVTKTNTFQSLPVGEPEVLGQIYVYKVSNN